MTSRRMTARLLLAALLLMLVSLDTMALEVDEDFYTCVPGIKPNIGGEWMPDLLLWRKGCGVQIDVCWRLAREVTPLAS